MTGNRTIDAGPLLEYFQPLHDFLKAENNQLAREQLLRTRLVEFNKKASLQFKKKQLADWARVTDLNNDTKAELYQTAVRESAEFSRNEYEQHFKGIAVDELHDGKLRRQILRMKNLGLNALDNDKLGELGSLKSGMEKTYNNAQFCSYSKPNCTKDEEMKLDPGKLETVEKTEFV